MQVTREEMYFEPRCVRENGSVSWYGEGIIHPALDRHILRTVYIRDTGSRLFIYRLEEDERTGMDEKEIRATFRLICRVGKRSTKHIYGRKIPGKRV